MSSKPPAYTMTISRMTVDKLGVKLYDRVSAVIAELVANSYDADATEVTIKAPMGELLANKVKGDIQDRGHTIEVRDNGVGMTPEQINRFYLRVGAERRNDPDRGPLSPRFGRKVMGRKGVGKLAPFGICQEIEVLTSGGEPVDGQDENGNPASGHLTAHLTLDSTVILSDIDEDYEPKVGHLDRSVQPGRGTTIILRRFAHRSVPRMDDFTRQLAQRFGIASADWSVKLIDSLATAGSTGHEVTIGEFSIEKMDNTEIRFMQTPDEAGVVTYQAIGSGQVALSDLQAGFEADNRFYPVTGWVAYSKVPYRDDLMAGIRIYCRGKIASQTSVFNLRAGFTGEFDVRSYLVGELHADWLDEHDDLIQTDRRDIMWSHELGQAFEKWGQAVVRRMGVITRQPMKTKAWDRFRETSGIDGKVEAAFPGNDQVSIRDKALELAKMIASTMRGEEIEDKEQVAWVVNWSTLFAPHVILDTKLREAGDKGDRPLAVVTEILRTARVAELSSFGRIADERVRVIETVERLKDDAQTLEAAFQDLITSAPWLVDPQWSPITTNQSFSTLRQEFQKYYNEQTGENIVLGEFADSAKRADFVLSSQDNVIQIIEIKRPSHRLSNEEMTRIDRYVGLMQSFLAMEQNAEFGQIFKAFHVTVVCDEINLTGVHRTAFEGLQNSGMLTSINWRTFLLRTRRMHEAFLNEAERQKRLAVIG